MAATTRLSVLKRSIYITRGEFNVAIGFNDMSARNTTGNSNTAIGAFALKFNTTGNNNTAVGLDAWCGAVQKLSDLETRSQHSAKHFKFSWICGSPCFAHPVSEAPP